MVLVHGFLSEVLFRTVHYWKNCLVSFMSAVQYCMGSGECKDSDSQKTSRTFADDERS